MIMLMLHQISHAVGQATRGQHVVIESDPRGVAGLTFRTVRATASVHIAYSGHLFVDPHVHPAESWQAAVAQILTQLRVS